LGNRKLLTRDTSLSRDREINFDLKSKTRDLAKISHALNKYKKTLNSLFIFIRGEPG
jgi:hypothetical protein